MKPTTPSTTWTYNNVPQTFLFDRGFTGHSLSRYAVIGKHLDVFGLINMPARRSLVLKRDGGGNGRTYDSCLPARNEMEAGSNFRLAAKCLPLWREKCLGMSVGRNMLVIISL